MSWDLVPMTGIDWRFVVPIKQRPKRKIESRPYGPGTLPNMFDQTI